MKQHFFIYRIKAWLARLRLQHTTESCHRYRYQTANERNERFARMRDMK